ncbi:SMP-30/gluconolactonase/LRE family protein, partial [Flavobacteriaceae bacterium]|nr:SMP-30/gluconolactonase/LRE family protein [Flavobacteriaceae bacterium]
MKSKTIFALTSLIILSCYPAKTVIDFTPEGSFTNGIEGPATDFEGNIYAVNFEEEGTIGRVTPEGKSSIFIKLPNGSIGNGIRFGEKYQMFIADFTNHNILEIDLRTKKLTVFAHETNANQPNDITVLRKNIVFASDPKWSDSTG